MNKDGTDVYFHVVNRTTGKVLPYQDEWVKRYIKLLQFIKKKVKSFFNKSIFFTGKLPMKKPQLI